MLRLFTLLAVLIVAAPALACSPAVHQPSFRQKVDGAQVVFIGTVESANVDTVIFRIVTPHKGAPAAGETIQLDHKGYGTCGELQFREGGLWLYAGDSPFSASRELEEGDAGKTVEEIVARFDGGATPGGAIDATPAPEPAKPAPEPQMVPDANGIPTPVPVPAP